MRLTGSWCSSRVSGVSLCGGRAEFKTLTFQHHKISIGKSSPRDLCLNVKTQLHLNEQEALGLDTLCQTTSKTGTKPHPLAERMPKIIVNSQNPKHTTGRGPAHQKDKIQPHPLEHRHQSPQPGSLHKPLNQPYPLGADTKKMGTMNVQPVKRRPQTQ